MAARGQTTYYPDGKRTNDDICTLCIEIEFVCFTKSCVTMEAPDAAPCPSYCNTGCNTSCKSVQAYCSVGVQEITSHADVGTFSWTGCIAKDEIIMKAWTAAEWNTLAENIQTAYNVGLLQMNGAVPDFTEAVADPCNNSHPEGSLITADMYNEFTTALQGLHSTLPTVVQKETVISGEAADAQLEGFLNATFNTNVCDLCNAAGNQSSISGKNCVGGSCTCGCSCACTCMCSCACSCGCSSPG